MSNFFISSIVSGDRAFKSFQGKRCSAFTLVELLVVIAIIDLADYQ